MVSLKHVEFALFLAFSAISRKTHLHRLQTPLSDAHSEQPELAEVCKPAWVLWSARALLNEEYQILFTSCW